ncbi:N/A [soil metagenome]
MALTISHLTHRYGARSTPVLEDVSFALAPARVLAIVGPNGAGKSTLARLLMGLALPSAGAVAFSADGAAVYQAAPARRARALAYVPQSSAASESFTTREIVALGRLVSGGGGARRDDDAAVERALERAEAAEFAGAAFHELSAGQRQRVTLARALAQLDGRPGAGTAMIADEPTAAQDPRAARVVLRVLRAEAAAGRAVVVVLHDLLLARSAADDALVLTGQGTVAALGPVQEVLVPEVLDAVFRTPFERIVAGEGRELVIARMD